jgi:hypothetical protein
VDLGGPGSAGNKSGSAGDKSGSANDKPRSASGMSGITSNHSRAVWENHLVGNAAGVPGNHTYYLSLNDCYKSCNQIVFWSIYLCIYVCI